MLQKPKKYWNEKNILLNIREIINIVGRFPTQDELISMNRYDLVHAIQKHGGFPKFRELMGYDYLRKPNGYWTNEKIIGELKEIINKLSHFPTVNELLLMGKDDLVGGINRNNGLPFFRDIFNYKQIKKPNGYWTDETILNELKAISTKLGHFPTSGELHNIGRSDLVFIINTHGNINKFRRLLGYEPSIKPSGYWTEENTLKELKLIIEQLNYFPSQKELKIKDSTLCNKIIKYGGINKFRDILGYEKKWIQWNEELILAELRTIHDKIGYFPTSSEMKDMNKIGLYCAIVSHGGINKFRELLGYSVSLQEKYIAKLRSYISKRGHSSQLMVKDILIEWTNIHNLSHPQFNKKLGSEHILEFVCNTGKTVGIDVTNSSSKHTVYRKWTHKSYHKYLDELWIVVFSDSFDDSDYLKWNTESPKNVKVMPIYTFLEELDYSLDEHTKQKIDKYIICDFSKKDDLKNILT